MCYTQNFVWNKVYGGSHSDALIQIIESGSKDYIYNYVSTRNLAKNINYTKLNINDTFLKKNQKISDWLIKLDTGGRLVWGKCLFEPNGIISASFITDIDDNIYMFFYLDTNIDSIKLVINNKWYKLSTGANSTTHIVKFNKDGKFIWDKFIDNVTFSSSRSFSYLNNYNYFVVRKKINNSIPFLNDSIRDPLSIIKMDTSGIFLDNFNLGSGNYVHIPNIYKEKDSLIIFLTLNPSFYEIKNYKFNLGNKSHFIKLVINEYNKNQIRVVNYTEDLNNHFLITRASKIDDKKYIISGSFKDSIKFLKLKTIYSNSNNNIPFALSIFNDLPKSYLTLKSNDTNLNGQFFIGNSLGSYIYLGGSVNGNFTQNDSISLNKNGNLFYCKLDSLCNILWYIRTGDSINSNNPQGFILDNQNGVYFGNVFTKNININDKTYYSDSSSQDFIISKIYDYSITRGKVSKGPYCAGDTLLIPYTKEGNYGINNEFIAELSDENGFFDGNHRQLGKIKTNKDSVIKGILPLFDVITSPNYRIRIISTSPQVQSYFRTDTLRLLIYSKDTANAGNDTTICYNNTLQLKTTGGSKWQWSPGNLVNDSNDRIATTLPLESTTTFRIIISDSSGCGKTDTAYKTVYVLPKISIDSSNSTINLCSNEILNFNLNAKGGKGSYDFKWKPIDSTNWILGNTIPIIGNGNHVYIVQASDACSPIATTQISSFTYTKPKIYLPKDTLICPLISTNLKLKYFKDAFGQTQIGGKPPYNFNWNASKTLLQSKYDSIIHNFNTPDSVNAYIFDACGNSDTASILIKLDIPLSGQINLSNPCFIDTAHLALKPLFMNNKKNLYQWIKDGNVVSYDSIINFSTKNTNTILIAKLSDNCNNPFIDTIELTPIVTANLNVSKVFVCENKNEFIFKNLALFNNKKINNYNWLYPNNFLPIFKDSSTLIGNFNKAGDYSIYYEVISNNNCLSKDSISVTVYPKPPINITWQRTTNTFDVSQWRFTASSSFSLNTIHWNFGNLGVGNGSPFYKTFYNSDTIKANVSITDINGCTNDSFFKFYLIHRKQFFIPNAVTCNNDGINDVFIIDGAEWMKEFDLNIFNRWGELVFKTNNPLEPWIPDDNSNNLYIYTLTIFDVYNERHLLKGVVEVIR